MIEGQQIRNVSDVSTDITRGRVYTLTSDVREDTVFFKDDAGCARMRLRRDYELVQPKDDNVLTFLKDRAKELQTSELGTSKSMKFNAVVSFLYDHYGLVVRVTPQIEFLPVNG